MKKNGITEASKRHIMKLEKSDDLLKLQKKIQFSTKVSKYHTQYPIKICETNDCRTNYGKMD